MEKRLPPLDWVRVFEMAARSESFVTAAESLSVSSGAVSRTVKELEQYLGVKLFRRLSRGVELTKAGRDYAAGIAPAIAQIELAAESIEISRRSKIIRVTAMPAFAELWLVPRLGDFRTENPNISVEISAESRLVDLARSEFDLAIRYCDGESIAMPNTRLFDDELYPVISPRFKKGGAFESIDEVFGFPVLQDMDWMADWHLWLSEVDTKIPPNWDGISFTLYSMAISAAAAGHGIVMGHDVLVKDEIDKGNVFVPYETRVTSRKGFYLVRNPNSMGSSPTSAFVDWLVKQGQAG